MDLISDALAATRTGGSVFAKVNAGEPWGLACDGPPVAAFHIVARGACHLILHEQPITVDIGPGDLVIVPRGNPHTLTDDPESPTVSVREFVPTLSDEPIGRGRLGTGPETTTIICGVYNYDAPGPHPLMRDLPPVLHLRADDGPFELQSAVALLINETGRAELGSLTVVNRMADVVLVHALRRWIRSAEHERAPGLLTALADPLIADVLARMHQRPEASWTAKSLAADVGASASTIKKRFTALVGEPPSSYLRRHRLDLAARLLRESQLTMAEIAGATGYGSEASFSRAFATHHGLTPGRYRTRQRDVATIVHPNQPHHTTATGDGPPDQDARSTP